MYCAPNTGQESFGIVLLEAMAAGVPIVASDIHGFKRVVERNVQGILVEPRNRARSPPPSTRSRAMPTCATTWARPGCARRSSAGTA